MRSDRRRAPTTRPATTAIVRGPAERLGRNRRSMRMVSDEAIQMDGHAGVSVLHEVPVTRDEVSDGQ
jgi:hypothetical protein